MKTYKDFTKYIDLLASEFNSVNMELSDFCHEQADSSEYVIYYGKAWDLVNLIRLTDYSLLEDAEIALEFSECNNSINQYMTLLAYEIIYQQLSLAVNEL